MKLTGYIFPFFRKTFDFAGKNAFFLYQRLTAFHSEMWP